jgi:hypothetical protein
MYSVADVLLSQNPLIHMSTSESWFVVHTDGKVTQLNALPESRKCSINDCCRLCDTGTRCWVSSAISTRRNCEDKSTHLGCPHKSATSYRQFRHATIWPGLCAATNATYRLICISDTLEIIYNYKYKLGAWFLWGEGARDRSACCAFLYSLQVHSLENPPVLS